MRQTTLSTSIWIQKLFFCSNLAELGIDIDGKANETSADDDAIFCLCTYSFDNSKLQLLGGKFLYLYIPEFTLCKQF